MTGSYDTNIMGVCICRMSNVVPTDIVTSHSAVEKSRELVGEFYEEEKESMHKRIKELFERALLNPRVLTTINLSLCSLGEPGAYQLSNLISHTPDVLVLKLWKCHLGPKGIEFLAEHLSKLTKLKVLALEDNQLGAEGVNFLARSLLLLPTLEEVYLHENQISTEGAKILSKAVANLVNIRVFTLDENDIRSDGLTPLLGSLPLARLTTLGLAYNNIDDRGAALLVQRAADLQALLKLSFDGNPVSATVKASVEAAFKKAQIY